MKIIFTFPLLFFSMTLFAAPCDESWLGMKGDAWYLRCLEDRDPKHHTIEKDDRVQAQCEAEWEKRLETCQPYTHDYLPLPVEPSIFEEVMKT